jgi:hypothetical protein
MIAIKLMINVHVTIDIQIAIINFDSMPTHRRKRQTIEPAFESKS